MANPISLEKAALYEKYRLPYAVKAVDDLLDQINEVEIVADIGAGTGQLARLFAGRGCRIIYAVEPDSSMREIALESLRVFPEIDVIDGSAEDTTLSGGSVDLIVIGNAFHRFKPEACRELRRILKPTGWIALFSYSFINAPFKDKLFSKLSTIESWASRTQKSWHRMPIEYLFGDGQIRRLRYLQSKTESWEAFLGSACAGIEAPERSEKDFTRFEEINREVFDTFSEGGKIQIEYETTVSLGQLIY